MNSHLTSEQLQRLVDEHLDPSERSEVEAHVNGCEPCTERLVQLIKQCSADGTDDWLRHVANARTLEPLQPFLRDLQQTPPSRQELLGPEEPSPGWPTIPAYQVLDKLGEGGMGVVYKARQLTLNRLIALKMILAGGYAPEEAVARFRNEAEAVARLQHSNIVQIHEVGEFRGQPYFTLEFVAGGNLREKLREHLPLPRQAAELVERLAQAMHEAHQLGIVHRDLKTANVLLAPSDGPHAISLSANPAQESRYEPKIADFGLAKFLGGLQNKNTSELRTPGGAIVGTPSYMAPEQAGGPPEDVGPAADIYALGAILYELLTAKPPFTAATDLDTLIQVVSDDPVPPRLLQPRTPGDLETICLKCLEKVPAKRYPTAKALAEDLRHFLNAEPLEYAKPLTLLEWLQHALERRINVNDIGSWGDISIRAGFTTLLGHGVMFALIQSGQPVLLLWLWLVFYELSCGLFFQSRLQRRGRSLTTAEQEMRMLWAGNTVAYFVLFWVNCPPFGTATATDALRYYPSLAVVVGLTFFAEGRVFWGRLYLIGLGYFALALLMPLQLEWAALMFSLFDAAAMFYIGIYLRRLSAHEAAA
jgi:serine/threonine protein kinase